MFTFLFVLYKDSPPPLLYVGMCGSTSVLSSVVGQHIGSGTTVTSVVDRGLVSSAAKQASRTVIEHDSLSAMSDFWCRLGIACLYHLRPYRVEINSSRLIPEVKQNWTMLLLGWVNTWEYDDWITKFLWVFIWPLRKLWIYTNDTHLLRSESSKLKLGRLDNWG